MSTTTQRGSQFEEEVRQLLQLKGYDVTRNELINGTQIDLVARRNDLFDNLCFVVECTDRVDAVGVDLVKQKASVLLSLHDPKYLFRLIYVARNGFTAEAKAFAAAQPTIILLTLKDLEAQLIDFGRYAEWYLYNYEASSGFFSEGQLYGNYIELAGRDQRGALSILSAAVNSWLVDSSNNLLFLLGEYGSGKTSFCRHLTYELLVEKFRGGGKQKLTPILFNLREYRKAFSVQQLVTDVLVNQYSLELRSFMAFERICSSGRILLILDGFDEMADKSDKQTLVECFRQIYTLASLNTKIIVSCRSNFFQSNSDVIDLLRQFSIEIPYSDGPEQRVTRLSFDRQGTILTVEKLNDEQIRKYTENRFGAEADAIYSSIRSIHDLSDLSTRPVLLDMVLRTLPELSEAKKRINSAALYEHYTDRWTARDEWRVATQLKLRQQFCAILAWHMHHNGFFDISYPRLEQMMVRALEPLADSNEQLEGFKNDIQTCSFLVRAGAGDTFRFAHKSFVEYFVARKLVADLTGGMGIERPVPENSSTKGRVVGILLHAQVWPPTSLVEDDMASFLVSPRFKVSLPQLGQTQLQLDQSFISKLELEIRAVFESQSVAAQARPFPISEEIATFALERLENMDVSLEDFVSKANEESTAALVGEIFRLGRATEFVRRNQNSIRNYVLGDGREVLKIAFCAALAKVPGAVDVAFLQQARNQISPEGWSYFLIELASQLEYRNSLFQQNSQWENLRTVDEIIFAHARYDSAPTGKEDMVTEAFVIKLLESGYPEDIKLGLSLFTYIQLLSEDMVKSTIRAYRCCTDRSVKEDILAFLCGLGGEKACKALRSLRYGEQDGFLKKKLVKLEEQVRDIENREKTRQSWDQAKVHRQVKEKMWKSLR